MGSSQHREFTGQDQQQFSRIVPLGLCIAMEISDRNKLVPSNLGYALPRPP